MTKTPWTRRALLAGAAATGTSIIVNRSQAADYKFIQYHNQAEAGTLHKNLVAMWDAIGKESNGRIAATIYPENNKLTAGDPAALKLLLAGEIQFFTLMGGIIGTVVPLAEIQQAPFAFAPPSKRKRRSTARSAPIWARRWPPRACTCFPLRASTTACGRSPWWRARSTGRRT